MNIQIWMCLVLGVVELPFNEWIVFHAYSTVAMEFLSFPYFKWPICLITTMEMCYNYIVYSL